MASVRASVGFRPNKMLLRRWEGGREDGAVCVRGQRRNRKPASRLKRKNIHLGQ